MVARAVQFLVFGSVLGVCTALSAGTTSDLPMRILEPVTYHGDEINAKSGETWMGLYRTSDGFELRPEVITVTIVEDPVIDEEGAMTGKRVSVDGDAQPLYLFNGLPDPSAAAVKSSFSGRTFLLPGQMEPVTNHWNGPGTRLTENVVQLAALGEVKDTDYGPSVQSYRLMLYRDLWKGPGQSARQEIAAFEHTDGDGQPVLLWAGDLDGDDRVDLIMDLTNHYNMGGLTLFLSSLAKDGEIVGKAAELVTYGC